MYKKVKHRYIQKSVRQTCSKEGIDSGGTAGGVPSGRRSPGSQVNNHPGYQLGLWGVSTQREVHSRQGRSRLSTGRYSARASTESLLLLSDFRTIDVPYYWEAKYVVPYVNKIATLIRLPAWYNNYFHPVVASMQAFELYATSPVYTHMCRPMPIRTRGGSMTVHTGRFEW